MKKILLSFLALFFAVSIQAQEFVEFTVQRVPQKPLGHDGPRDLIDPPTVYIEDYVLMFEANHPDYVLNIKNATGTVVFTTFVCSAMTLAPLPYTLSGDYEIELVYGYWLFTGYINL
jgi:hypothetical protein